MLNVLFSRLPTQIMWEIFDCLTIYSHNFILSCPGQCEELKPRWGRKWAMWEWAGASWSWEALGRDGSPSAITPTKPVSGSARQRDGAKIKVANACVEVEEGVCFKLEAWAIWLEAARERWNWKTQVRGNCEYACSSPLWAGRACAGTISIWVVQEWHRKSHIFQ